LHSVSLDGGKIGALSQLPDKGLSQKFSVTMVPAVFAVNPKSGEYFPIATGAISEQEIEDRIFQIAAYQTLRIGNKYVE